MQVDFIQDREIYDRVIMSAIPNATRFLWMATANLKDLHVNKGRRMVPFLDTLARLAADGVQIRMLHASEPGPRFREDFDKYPSLINGMERVLCPRCHLKCVVVDGTFAYMGSANLTGAGMGAKGDHTRNFEMGVTSSDSEFVEKVMAQYDSIWMGSQCDKCRRKDHCSDFRDMQE